MSKKSKKKPQATFGVAAAADAATVELDALPPPQFRLAEMQASARAHFENKAWAEILALGRVPLTAIHEAHEAPRNELMQEHRVWDIAPPGDRSTRGLLFAVQALPEQRELLRGVFTKAFFRQPKRIFGRQVVLDPVK